LKKLKDDHENLLKNQKEFYENKIIETVISPIIHTGVIPNVKSIIPPKKQHPQYACLKTLKGH
jgi:hypothetical protein